LNPAAAYLSISPRNLRALVSSGSLPVIRVSARRIAFDQVDLDAYIDKQRS
jgi:excisionase family DNA binding protein